MFKAKLKIIFSYFSIFELLWQTSGPANKLGSCPLGEKENNQQLGLGLHSGHFWLSSLI